MIGNNKIIVNEATMMVAFQLWLDSKFKDGESPVVTGIRLDQHEGFEIMVQERDKPPVTHREGA